MRCTIFLLIAWFFITFYMNVMGTCFPEFNMDDFLKEREPELQQVCNNEVKEYTWISPSGKIFHFDLVMGHIAEHWKLTKVNEIPVWVMDKSPAMLFQIFSSPMRRISLGHLYPTYPKFSGVDAFQFLLSLAYICKFTISLYDGAPISEPYKLIFGKGYYEQLIKGLPSEIYINSVIEKDNFLNCVHYQVSGFKTSGAIYKKIKTNLDVCNKIEDDKTIENCPIDYPWLSIRLYHHLFQFCCIPSHQQHGEFERIKDIDQNNDFEIKYLDLHRIFHKKYPPKLPSYEETMLPVSQTLTLKTKEKIEFELEHGSISQILKESFEFCIDRLGKKEFTPIEIFKNVMQECIPETVNFLFKYDCDSFKIELD